MVVSLSTFYPESQDRNGSEDAIDFTIHRLIAKLPTLAAMSYKNAVRHPFIYPKNELGYVENFLNMMFAMPTEEYKPDPVVAAALDRKSTRLNSSHVRISYAVFCLKKKKE